MRLGIQEQNALVLHHAQLQLRLAVGDASIHSATHIFRQLLLRDAPRDGRDVPECGGGEAEGGQHEGGSSVLQHREVHRLQILVQRRYTSRHGRIPT